MKTEDLSLDLSKFQKQYMEPAVKAMALNFEKMALRNATREDCCSKDNIKTFKSMFGWHMETTRKDVMYYGCDMMGNENHKPSYRDEVDTIDVMCCSFCGKK